MLKHTFVALLLVTAPVAWGAESGKAGETSTSRFTITLALQPTLEIRTATDISINIEDRQRDVTYQQPFCVRGTIDTKYSVTASGDTGGDGRFVLVGSDGESLPFSVAYLGNPGASSTDPLVDGIASPTYSILPTGNDCNGRTYFVVTFLSEDLLDAGSGLYNGSLTFLVSPV